MKTVVEADRTGAPLRVYHQTARAAWTHAYNARLACEACQANRIPADVKRGEGKADR